VISIVIASYKEPETIKKAISQALKQHIRDIEFVICAPDNETLSAARVALANYNVKKKIFRDAGKGKPAALNLAFSKCSGDIAVLTDGDVFMKENVLKGLHAHFKDPKVGAVTGRVVSLNSRTKMLGFWSHSLCESFHRIRLYESRKGKNILCSGYLYAIRRKLFEPIPENTLADDAYISLLIQEKGYQTLYHPAAEVYVKYPSTLADWIRQKKRTAGRVYQLSARFKRTSKNALFEEIHAALLGTKSIQTVREALWFFLLLGMKGYIWLRTLLDFRLRNKPLKDAWQRVESTK